MKGYKAVRPDMTSLNGNIKYEIGKTYEMDGEIEICKRGFHFCEDMLDCFDFCERSPFTIILEVETPDDAKIINLVDVVEDTYGLPYTPKICTNKMKILRRISQDEICKEFDMKRRCHNFSAEYQYTEYLNALNVIRSIGSINIDEFELNATIPLKDLYNYYGLYTYIYLRFVFNITPEVGEFTKLFIKYIDERYDDEKCIKHISFKTWEEE